MTDRSRGKRRRSKGAGSVFYDRNARRWVARVRVSGRSVKRTAATQEEAEAALEKLCGNLGAGLPIPALSMTVSELLDQWIASLEGRQAPSTLRVHRWAAGRWADLVGSTPASELTPLEIEAAFRRFTNDDGALLSRASLEKARVALRRAYRWGRRRGLVANSPVEVTELPPTKPRGRGRPVTEAEARDLLQAARDHRLEALFAVMIGLGLRPAEAFALTWADVDLERGLVHIRHALREGPDGPVLGEPKTTRGHRTLEAPSWMLPRLADHRRRQATERLAAGPSWPAEWDGLVFRSQAGTPLRRYNVTKALRRIAAAAEIDPAAVHLYGLRHTFGTMMAKHGVPLEHVADAMGHQSTQTTRQHYVHALGASIPHAAAALHGLADAAP